MSKKIVILLLVFVMAASLFACAQTPTDDGDGKALNFKYNDVVMAPGDKFDDISAKLGEPTSYYEAASCAFDGKDKIYTYGSLQISVSPMAGVDVIYMITLLDDALATPEGVRVGTERAAVLEAYGNGGVDKGTSLVYNSGKTDLVFLLRDGCVTSVQYRYVDAVING